MGWTIAVSAATLLVGITVAPWADRSHDRKGRPRGLYRNGERPHRYHNRDPDGPLTPFTGT